MRIDFSIQGSPLRDAHLGIGEKCNSEQKTSYSTVSLYSNIFYYIKVQLGKQKSVVATSWLLTVSL